MTHESGPAAPYVDPHRAKADAMSLDDLLAYFERHLSGSVGMVIEYTVRRLGKLAEPKAVDLAVNELSRSGTGGPGGPRAARLLQLARAERAVPALVACLPGGTVRANDPLRHAVVEALGWIGSPDALRALVWAAVEWQGATGPRPSGRMRPACKECGQYLAEALCRSPTPESVDALLGMTRRMDRLWSERTLSAVARVADERFVPFFVELCAGPARDVGLTGLRRTATDRAVPALLHILAAAPDRRTRDRAAQALATAVSADHRAWAWGGGRWERVPDPTSRHPDPRVRRSMAWVAGRAAHPADAAVSYLREPLRDPDDLVRAQAVASLGLIVRDLVPPTSYLPDQDPQALLLRALDDPCYRVRARAATAVGRLNLRREADELHLRHAARYDPVRCVRDAAEAALRARYHPVRKAPPGE